MYGHLAHFSQRFDSLRAFFRSMWASQTNSGLSKNQGDKTLYRNLWNFRAENAHAKFFVHIFGGLRTFKLRFKYLLRVLKIIRTVITLFFVVEIFSDGICCPKICYLNIVPVQKYFSRRSSKKRFVPVTLPLITSSLLMKMERTSSILHGRWVMVIPSLITATAYLALT